MVYYIMPATPAQLRAMKKWRDSHKTHYLEKQRKYQKKYYDENNDKILAQKKEYYENVIKPKRQKQKQEQKQEHVEELPSSNLI